MVFILFANIQLTNISADIQNHCYACFTTCTLPTCTSTAYYRATVTLRTR